MQYKRPHFGRCITIFFCSNLMDDHALNMHDFSGLGFECQTLSFTPNISMDRLLHFFSGKLII